MAECDECGEYENLPYQCHRCGETFCADHRLPENHDCPGLNEWNDPGGVFDSGFDDSVQTGGSSEGVADRVRSRIDRHTSTGGALGYFRGNMTYTFLGLMWLTFAFQIGLTIIGLGRLAELLFVLSPRNPVVAYLWTPLTSIFAHGGFGHIAVNSIALYFFGPVVERRLGFRRYVGLFLGAGVAAGLAQIGIGVAMGDPVPGVVGASGAIMAVMGLLTVLNPGLRVYLYFIIPMPLWILTFGFAGLSIAAGLDVGFALALLGERTAHFAHLAGLFVGLAYGARIQGERPPPESLQFGGGGGRGPGGPGGPGGGRGPP